MDDQKTEVISVRIPAAMKQDLEHIAETETRSLSQQILHFCKQGIQKWEKDNPDKKEVIF